MQPPPISGLILTPLHRFPNPKGDVFHAMKRSCPGFAGFGEAYFTTILPGHTKGWHKHQRMTMNLIVPMGAARFALVDDRPDSDSRGQRLIVDLSPEHYRRLTIPAGVWTAFTCIGRHTSLILNLSSIEYDDSEVVRKDLSHFPCDLLHPTPPWVIAE